MAMSKAWPSGTLPLGPWRLDPGLTPPAAAPAPPAATKPCMAEVGMGLVASGFRNSGSSSTWTETQQEISWDARQAALCLLATLTLRLQGSTFREELNLVDPNWTKMYELVALAYLLMIPVNISPCKQICVRHLGSHGAVT